jgi:hypothetical protein
LAVHHITDPAGRHVNVGRQLARPDAHGLHEVFQQNFAGVNFVKEFRHVSLLVVIHNFNLMRAVFTPNKAQPPLVVDADAVLTLTAILQGFELVARWNP